ncbi:hypothetical protein PRZ48_004836 [Zasmidium cellare]|uniref:Xylanolytic transcriptional activator regulatory domain-containing protein n=1 Tax=Zasmidium cellare TaxID=395010 RepID=A0ABR0ERP7_ZASCE|nr:hypothetical protein PRZ48_004836 [Zasmidium cellare]
MSTPDGSGQVPNSSVVSPGTSVPFAQPPMLAHEGLPDTGMMGFDFWDQNILSATNWLDALDSTAFVGYPLSHMESNEQFFSPFGASNNGVHAMPGPVAATPTSQNRSQVQTESPQSIFSPRSAAVTEGNTSHTSFDGGPAEVGQYYVDGEPARLPRVKRRKISQSQPTPQADTTIGFSLQMRPVSTTPEQSPFKISAGTYNAILESYQRLCISPPPGWAAYGPVELPSVDILTLLLGLYHRHFSQTLPVLHPLSFGEDGPQQGLALAMAALGTHYLEDAGSARLSKSMHEFVRRLLLYQQETVSDGSLSPCWTCAELFNLVGMAYCEDQKLQQHALSSRHRLAAVFAKARHNWTSERQGPSHGESNETEFRPWIRLESAVRLAYGAWMTDCMFHYHFQTEHVLSLKDAQMPLPCEDRRWSATTEQEWKEQTKVSQSPTLNEALQALYIEKHLPKDCGEFARILIIHGLYHRMWEVADYLSNPMSHWEPTASRQASSDVLPSTPIWLPSIPTFTRWQNSACDCLDVLHWQANATIGQASGLEHPTVLHLHLARIILLAPHAEITNLAEAMILPSATRDNDEMLANKRLIQRWAIQHQYKARLAIIHAGVVFWHVRRYSVDGFHEAPAVALAALTLWAFGTFSNRKALSRSTSLQPQNKHPSRSQEAREESDQSDDASCNIILLDRPADDEIVQSFIRNGHNMKANVAGSDLYASKGPERALRQGCKLLASLRCWGISTHWNRLLQSLVETVQKTSTKT